MIGKQEWDQYDPYDPHEFAWARIGKASVILHRFGYVIRRLRVTPATVIIIGLPPATQRLRVFCSLIGDNAVATLFSKTTEAMFILHDMYGTTICASSALSRATRNSFAIMRHPNSYDSLPTMRIVNLADTLLHANQGV